PELRYRGRRVPQDVDCLIDHLVHRRQLARAVRDVIDLGLCDVGRVARDAGEEQHQMARELFLPFSREDDRLQIKGPIRPEDEPVAMREKWRQHPDADVAVLVDGRRQNCSAVLLEPCGVVCSASEERNPERRAADDHCLGWATDKRGADEKPRYWSTGDRGTSTGIARVSAGLWQYARQPGHGGTPHARGEERPRIAATLASEHRGRDRAGGRRVGW